MFEYSFGMMAAFLSLHSVYSFTSYNLIDINTLAKFVPLV